MKIGEDENTPACSTRTTGIRLTSCGIPFYGRHSAPNLMEFVYFGIIYWAFANLFILVREVELLSLRHQGIKGKARGDSGEALICLYYRIIWRMDSYGRDAHTTGWRGFIHPVLGSFRRRNRCWSEFAKGQLFTETTEYETGKRVTIQPISRVRVRRFIDRGVSEGVIVWNGWNS